MRSPWPDPWLWKTAAGVLALHVLLVVVLLLVLAFTPY